MGTWRVALPMSAGSSFHGRRKPNGIGVPPGLVGHLEPGVAVELLERVDPGVNRRAKSRGTRRGRPRFHQATMLANTAAMMAATPCAVSIQSIMPDPYVELVHILTLRGRLAE
jgi:hypothetical protein